MVDAARMRRNLDLTGGLIVAEAVMMGLAPVLGREPAHHAVKQACDRALSEGIPLVAALLRETEVTARLDRAAIERLADPGAYLGSSDAFIDRILSLGREAACLTHFDEVRDLQECAKQLRHWVDLSDQWVT